MAISGVNRLRFSGLASGMDTEALVKNMMSIEKMRIDSVLQKKQIAEWRRDSYREFTNMLRGFKSEFMDVLRPSTNMLSQANYKVWNAAATNAAGEKSTAVTATASSSAAAGTYTVNEIKQLATAAQAKSTSGVTSDLVSENVDISKLTPSKFSINLDGVNRTIEFTEGDISGVSTVESLKELLQDKIDTAFGTIKRIDEEGNEIQIRKIEVKIQANGEEGEHSLILSTANKEGVSKITMNSGDALGLLGFSPGDTNRLSLGTRLGELNGKLGANFNLGEKDENGIAQISFTINGKTFEFNEHDVLLNVINKVNSDPDAKVNLQYDEASDKFILTAKDFGAGTTLQVKDGVGNFLESIGIGDNGDTNGFKSGALSEGQDSITIINGESIVRSSNTFTVNGITYTLHQKTTTNEPQTVTLTLDTTKIYDNIKSVVDKYNEMIDKINSTISEKYNRKFPPLTDEQKESMSEKDIEKWEQQAKAGLLRNDSILQNIVTDMRRALFDPIDGVSKGLASIGINTGVYTEKGKLNIDETKLKAAIGDDPDGVMNLFAKRSETVPSYTRTLTAGQRADRYKEQGLMQRLSDIIEDNISTFTNNDGRKGLLLERAGIEGDRSITNNTIYKEIEGYDKRIDNMWSIYYRKEEALYRKFTAMEKALSQMQNQGNSLLAQLGMGGQ